MRIAAPARQMSSNRDLGVGAIFPSISRPATTAASSEAIHDVPHKMSARSKLCSYQNRIFEILVSSVRCTTLPVTREVNASATQAREPAPAHPVPGYAMCRASFVRADADAYDRFDRLSPDAALDRRREDGEVQWVRRASLYQECKSANEALALVMPVPPSAHRTFMPLARSLRERIALADSSGPTKWSVSPGRGSWQRKRGAALPTPGSSGRAPRLPRPE